MASGRSSARIARTGTNHQSPSQSPITHHALPRMRLGVLLPHRAVVLQSARRPPVEECWAVARLATRRAWTCGWATASSPSRGSNRSRRSRTSPRSRSAPASAPRSCCPALRQPTVLAHALANIDQLSQGRLVLGLGVGWGLPEIMREWEACGREHKRRARDLEEHVIVWRKLWSGEPVTHEGTWLQADRAHDRAAAVERGGAADPDHRGQSRRDDPGADRPRRAAGRRRRHDLSHRRRLPEAARRCATRRWRSTAARAPAFPCASTRRCASRTTSRRPRR